ncbi:hypothetical protein RclHR1_00170021 [Rhizophagus clarus]|uniref:Uncharacterized protein n=1 Tax=Rhizophagus clarus TaxID=94130 RepID=A0A2Z6QJ44_9GLOM|nr:hypothetical protein RclHR1_00170021 [Rhizophagus clarus]GET00930.1 hypothetical protein RCL_e4714_RclHR1_00170021 [Rhizophagus clarus]
MCYIMVSGSALEYDSLYLLKSSNCRQITLERIIIKSLGLNLGSKKVYEDLNHTYIIYCIVSCRDTIL